MFYFLSTLILIVCVLMVLVVLSQSSKGGGLSSQFGGGGGMGTNQVMGVQKTTDILEKITWGFAIALMILSISINTLISNPAEKGEQGYRSPNVERAGEIGTSGGGLNIPASGGQNQQGKQSNKGTPSQGSESGGGSQLEQAPAEQQKSGKKEE